MRVWPLVGRQAELQRLAQILGGRDATSVVLVGAMGVGKTRLAHEAVNQASARGETTYWGVATRAGASIPFGPVAHLLPPVGEYAGTSLDLIRLTAERLRQQAGPGRVVLGLDDAHLLDEASAALVHHLVLTRAAVVVATIRAAEPVPDAITALWKDGLAEWLDVRPLARAELDELVSEVTGGRVDGSTLQQLWDLSLGNVLFARELVEGALERRTLFRDGGTWRSRRPIGTGSRLAEVVYSRLDQLPKEVQGALEVVAIGEPFDAALLETVVAGSALESAERAGLVEVIPDARRTRIRLAHPLYGELLRARVPRLKARAISRQLADALECTAVRRRDDVPRLAVWRLEAGQTAPPGLLVRAARQLSDAFCDHALAERLARTAVDAGGGLRAQLVLAETLFRQGRSAEAETLLARLADTAGSSDRAEIALLRGHILFWGLGKVSNAEQVLDHAGDAGDEPRWRDELAVLRATIAFSRGRTQAALNDIETTLSRGSSTVGTALRALTLATGAWAFAGRTEQAVTRAERALQDDGLQPRMPLTVDRLLAALCVAYRLAGRFDDAEELARKSYEAALARDAEDLRATWALLLGEIALARGDAHIAMRRLREAASLLRERAWLFGLYGRAWCLGSLAEASALAGDVAAAAEALAEADAATPESLFIPTRERGRIWVAVAHGELSKARRFAADAARAASELGSHLVAAVGLHDLVRLGEPASVMDSLAQLAAQLESRLPGAYALHAKALAAEDGEALDAAAEEFAKIGAMLLAAEAAAEAARAHRRIGRNASALTSSGWSQRFLAGRLPVHTPTLDQRTEASPLTTREREVAGLAARGLTSRTIAQRLGVSERTVQNHLHNAYPKLGVHNRKELQTVLGEQQGDMAL